MDKSSQEIEHVPPQVLHRRPSICGLRTWKSHIRFTGANSSHSGGRVRLAPAEASRSRNPRHPPPPPPPPNLCPYDVG
ncbi:hypothetical protein E2C01_046825 [Portunus trituberculatus]|uniref:Uncharacterized protein n=1 Tax=Portunus trituberculatus TaxID=210409 RepID=A0A5B7G8T8_PORTR|nr:hypothetical protein [Portunus trituberculatus]